MAEHESRSPPNEDVVPVSEFKAAVQCIKELERSLGLKTIDVTVLLGKIKVTKRMAYRCRDYAYSLIKIRATFPGIP